MIIERGVFFNNIQVNILFNDFLFSVSNGIKSYGEKFIKSYSFHHKTALTLNLLSKILQFYLTQGDDDHHPFHQDSRMQPLQQTLHNEAIVIFLVPLLDQSQA